MSEYRIRVVTKAQMAEERRSESALSGQDWMDYGKQRIADAGDVMFVIRDSGFPGEFSGFDWECPGCGGILSGRFADEPVSGWDAPRWKVENADPEHLTLTPSLGCSRWRSGECIGHWWARDGKLVSA